MPEDYYAFMQENNSTKAEDKPTIPLREDRHWEL